MADYWAETGGEAPVVPPPAEPRRRWWPLAVVVLLLVAGLWVWLNRTVAQGDVLHVGSQRGGTKALMLASGALDGAPYRIEWSEFPAAQTLLEAIGAGAVDVGVVGDAPFQFAYQSGSSIKAVGAQAARVRPTGGLALLVPAKSGIRTVQELRGRSIATTRGSIGHYLVLRALEAKGLKVADVKLLFLSPGDAKAAFDSGSIDAWSIWSPYTATAFAEGARSIADGRDYLTGYGFDAANADAATAKRTVLADYLQREARAQVWAKTHPQAFAKALAKDTGLPLAIALSHVLHQPSVRVPIDAALRAEEREVVAQFRNSGVLAGNRPLDGAYLQLDPGPPHGD
ncbi:ABC transporter substrate-binding protein [Sphingomonas ginsenosidivorax]|uniref:Putative aliphatic sulfonates-binding protein n=1 Tax=Sphingomonas ginsenosidivorax TaxID=862135 RepID=A0A5C6UGK8_9SPHN|nr:ABC transporter substrate-binding protein [Sphingomonas ginsenosidivorax]TXC71306.1 ABC transporter substrate-binding protein [Sphingomonas ginsenosidivorax]